MPAFLSKILRVCSIGIFLYLCYLRITKVWSMLHHGSVGWVQSKECSFFVHIYFFGIFLLFLHQKSCAVIIFVTFFYYVPNFFNRILTNQKPKLVIKNWQWNCMLTYYPIQLDFHIAQNSYLKQQPRASASLLSLWSTLINWLSYDMNFFNIRKVMI